MTIVPRTCTELRDDPRGLLSQIPDPQPLAAFRQCAAYVLLGDPGMGKSTAFAEEQRVLRETALSITARDFATFDADHHPEWKDKTLFIDGLDEIRAGQTDPRPPIDRIRANLDKLGKPRFRLSCRHADWLDTDRKALEAVSPSGKVTVLRLDPLDDRPRCRTAARPRRRRRCQQLHRRGAAAWHGRHSRQPAVFGHARASCTPRTLAREPDGNIRAGLSGYGQRAQRGTLKRAAGGRHGPHPRRRRPAVRGTTHLRKSRIRHNERECRPRLSIRGQVRLYSRRVSGGHRD